MEKYPRRKEERTLCAVVGMRACAFPIVKNCEVRERYRGRGGGLPWGVSRPGGCGCLREVPLWHLWSHCRRMSCVFHVNQNVAPLLDVAAQEYVQTRRGRSAPDCVFLPGPAAELWPTVKINCSVRGVDSPTNKWRLSGSSTSRCPQK